jgi:tetratricopeptide (TPR) repeat protein
MKNILNNVRNVALVLAGIGIASACADYLDVPVNGQVPDTEFYKTDSDAVIALSAVYDGLSNSYNHIWASMYLLREIPSDDTHAGGADGNDQAGHQQIDDFIHESTNDQILPAWRNQWATIYRANKVVDRTTGDSPLKKRVIAEAKFLRAFIYFDLVTFWGKVPLVLTEVLPADYATLKEREETSVIYAQIEKDLTEAIVDLPERNEYGGADRFRASKGAAQALLGKVHLYQEEYDEAADLFDAVIATGEYELERLAIFNFSKSTEFGKESLFEINYVSTQQYDWGNYPWGGPTEDNIIVQLMGPRNVDGTPFSAPAGDSITLGWGFCNPTGELYDAYVDAGDVNRRMTFVQSVAEFQGAGGIWTPDDWDFDGVLRRKYGHFTTDSGPPITELNHTTNWRLIRFADVLLMAAEAHALKDTPDEAQALEYLNDVRQRPGTNLPDVVGASGAALFDAIVLERRLELSFEGHRFADLVRWGLADDELSDLGFTSNKNELYPIPNQDVIAIGMEQNPNY